MKRFMILAVVLFSANINAQSIPTLAKPVTLVGAQGMNAALASKADVNSGTLSSPNITGGTISGITSLSGASAAFTGSVSSGNIISSGQVSATSGNFSASVSAMDLTTTDSITAGSYFSSSYHIVPDTLKIAADGQDDAPSINRAAAACTNIRIRCEIDLLSRIYYINSAVNLSEHQVILKGMGVQERSSQVAQSNYVTPWAGTWLQVSTTGFTPVTMGGYGGGGSEISDLGIYEVQPVPPSSGTWTPTSYGPFFSSSLSLLSIRYHNIYMLGINCGIYSDGDQRLDISDIRGQIFSYAVSLHHMYDIPTIKDVHLWTYWSEEDPVITYQQSNADAFIIGRVDGAFIDNAFCYGCRSVYHLEEDSDTASGTPGGTGTKIVTGKTYCDFTYACIFIDSGAINFDMTAISVSSQGENASASGPQSGASAFIVNGYGNLNIHELYSQSEDKAVGQLLNKTAHSRVTIGMMRVNSTLMQSGGYLFGGYLPADSANIITLNSAPLMLGTIPSGFTVFQTGSSLIVTEPTITTLASGSTP